MSVDHFKKQAKNAKHHLPELFAKHPPPYSLTECQEFIALINGYPSWHIASKEAERKGVPPYDDPIAAFYGYDWRKSSLNGFPEVCRSATCRIEEKRLSSTEAWNYLMKRSKSPSDIGDGVILINQAGELGEELLDKLWDENRELPRPFSFIMTTGLSNRAGMTINPLEGFTAGQIGSLFSAILAPVASKTQVACCLAAIDLLLSGAPSGKIDLLALHQQVNRLIRLGNDDPWMDDEWFYELFPDETRHDEANDFLAQHAETLSDLLRPLDALLTRLAVPGLDKAFNPRRCKELREARDVLFEVCGVNGSEMELDLHGGLHIVNLNLGSNVLDHLAALFVIAKLRVTSRFYVNRGFAEAPPLFELILMKE